MPKYTMFPELKILQEDKWIWEAVRSSFISRSMCKSDYVCDHINCIGLMSWLNDGANRSNLPRSETLTDEINDALHCCFDVIEWYNRQPQRGQPPVPRISNTQDRAGGYRADNLKNDGREYRLQWLDHILAQLS